MSRTPIPFVADDVATLARALERRLADAEPLGHVEILNLLARATGFRNYQHLRASRLAELKLDAAAPPPPPEPPVDHARVAKVLRFFDDTRRLVRWPPKDNLRQLALWALWAALPPREAMNERQISERLRDLHLFGDHALLRRELVDRGLYTRTVDGRDYRRVERRPPPDARELIRRLAGRGPA